MSTTRDKRHRRELEKFQGKIDQLQQEALQHYASAVQAGVIQDDRCGDWLKVVKALDHIKHQVVGDLVFQWDLALEDRQILDKKYLKAV